MKIKKMMLLIFIPGTHYLWWAGLILISLRCDTTEPPTNGSLSLAVEDVSCTEAWLQLRSTNLQIPNIIILKQNNQARLTINLTTTDTLLYIDSLLPNQTYKFQSVILRKESFGQPFNQSEVRSNELSVTTMDTTSHNFTWQTFTFGEHSSSVLYDVAIIDENNIWAVGEIYMNDSLGKYNAIHWNGIEWELKQIPFYYNGSPTFVVIKSVFAFSENDIWFEAGIHWDGTSFEQIPVSISFPSHVNKLWGSNSNDLYAVGNGGNIAHWDGVKWSKIESTVGSNLRLNDVVGKTTDESIFISGYNPFGTHKSSLIKIFGNKVSLIWNSEDNVELPPYGLEIHSIDLVYNNLFVASNDGIFRKNVVLNTLPKQLFSAGWKVYKISGTEINDVYTIGDWSNIFHYNGFSARQVFYDYSVTNTLYSGKAKEKTIAGVGTKVENIVLHKALIVIGMRQ